MMPVPLQKPWVMLSPECYDKGFGCRLNRKPIVSIQAHRSLLLLKAIL